MKTRLFAIVMFFALGACSSNQSTAPQPEAPKYLQHQIKVSGETLGAIAKWYTGSPNNWTAIAQANPGLKPNRLRIGQTINIPDAIAVKREPFSSEYLAQLEKQPAVAAKTQQNQEEQQMARLDDQAVAVNPAQNLNSDPSPSTEAVAPGAPAPESPDSQLYTAVMFGEAAKIKELVAAGANINAREGNRPLLAWATQSDNTEVVKTLLDLGARLNDVDGIGHTPLMRAVDVGQMANTKLLLEAKADTEVKTDDGKTALFIAVYNNNLPMAQTLLQHGANPNIQTPDNDSLALIAAQNESIEMLRALGAAKANLNISNAAYTPLVYAIGQSRVEMVKALIELGADPNTPTSSGQIPVMQALDTPEVLNLLLAAKANVNVKNTYGQAPLITAVRDNNMAAAQALVAAGADVNATDANNQTILASVRYQATPEMIAFLEKNGAKEQ